MKKGINLLKKKIINIGVIGTGGAGDVDYDTGHNLKVDHADSKSKAEAVADKYWNKNKPKLDPKRKMNRRWHGRQANKSADFWGDNKVDRTIDPSHEKKWDHKSFK